MLAETPYMPRRRGHLVDNESNDYINTLKFWPYSQERLFEVATRELVEEHATFLLSRALNIGRLIAVVGAGVSASYGRTSWAELVDRIARNEVSKSSDLGDNHLVAAIKAQLQAILNEEDPNAYTVFQLADNLNVKLRVLQSLEGSQRPTIPSMRADVAEMTQNDKQHMEHLCKAAGGSVSITDMAPPRWEHVDESIRNTLGQQHNPQKPIPPYLRVAFALRPSADRVQRYAEYCKKYTPGDLQRNDIIARSRDPLMHLLKTLRIRRFITTNYDAEIERLFRDEGFRNPPGSNSAWEASPQKIDPTAPAARAIVFRSNEVGALTGFATQDRSPDVSVVYLHGRADESREYIEDLVTSEFDYQRRYASSDESRVAIEEATQLAFGANPLLFIGNGMSEDDVLRQLRLLSSSSRLLQRHGFALMPAWSKGKADQERLKLLQRFSVYTIHYGIFSIEGRDHYFLEYLSDYEKAWRKGHKPKFEGNLSDQTLRQNICNELAAFEINVDLEFKILDLFLKEQVSKSDDAKYLFANLIDAFQNALLSAALQKIAQHRSDWKKSWFLLPNRLELPPATAGERLLTRHVAEPVLKPNRDFRFHLGVPSPTFESFLRELTDMKACRSFRVNASRGLGRGHFFSAFMARRDQVARKLGLQDETNYYFASITHSTEVFSIFDQLTSFLSAQRSRLGRIANLAQALKHPGVVVLNGVHVLFDANGEPKNSQIRRILLELSRSECATVFLIGDWSNVDLTVFAETEKTPALPCQSIESTPPAHMKCMSKAIDLERFDPVVLCCCYFPTVVEILVLERCSGAQRACLAEIAQGVVFEPPSDLRGRLVAAVCKFDSVATPEKLSKLTVVESLCVALDSNRYLYSLALAACEVGATDTGADHCVKNFIEELTIEATHIDKARKPSKVIERVLDEYDRRHRDHPAPFVFRPRLNMDLARFSASILQKTVLWHLAVIGQPVIAEVLLACPMIKVACGRTGNGTNRINDDVFLEVLEEMVERCLVMRIQPRGGDAEEETLIANGVRFGIHKLMQEHILASLGSPLIEFPRADKYTVSMYASQPSDLPALTASAHSDIRATISALCAFPDGVNGPLIKDRNSKKLQLVAVRRLRAAFAILRSVYSVGVTSRFDASHSSVSRDGLGEPVRPFDDHRELVRWVYQQAKDPAPSVFYAEELAWLCNEAAVLSHVQGRLNDSVGLYDLAESAAKDFEPEAGTGRTVERGSVRTRIRLNRCIAQIDRGNLLPVESELEAITRIPDETQPLLAVAVGYLALVRHIRGQHARAERLYERALWGNPSTRRPGHGKACLAESEDTSGPADYQPVVGLVELKRSRACSIFYRHLGDLLRVMGNVPAAIEHVKTSITLAQEGGHEDIRHSSLASLLRCGFLEKWDQKLILGQICELETYASTMGIPRLMAEALEIKARVRRRAGDLTEARSLATKALLIATQYDLRLRKAGVLVLLGHIHHELGDVRSARGVAEAGALIARNCDHHIALAEATILKAQIGRGPL